MAENKHTIIDIKTDILLGENEEHKSEQCIGPIMLDLGTSPSMTRDINQFSPIIKHELRNNEVQELRGDEVVPYSPTINMLENISLSDGSPTTNMIQQLTKLSDENRIDIREIATRAVRLVLGEDNPYVCRLLVERLEGKEKNYRAMTIKKIISSRDYSDLKKSLSIAINTTQPIAVEVLREPNVFDPNGSPSLDPAKSQIISNWILKSVLDEKLKCREVGESAQRWKYINGILMLVLPVITPIIAGVIQHYFIDPCDCNCGSQ